MMLYILNTHSSSFVNSFADYNWTSKGQAAIEISLFIASKSIDSDSASLTLEPQYQDTLT